MKHRAIFVVFAFAAVAGSLSACSSEHPGSETLVPLSEVDAFEKHTYSHDSDTDTSEIDPTLTVQSAKERARAVENELVAFVPAEADGAGVEFGTHAVISIANPASPPSCSAARRVMAPEPRARLELATVVIASSFIVAPLTS